MKKILSILLTISILFSCINFNVFAETSGALSVSAPTSAVPGETINVTVSVPSGTNALSGSFNLVYDNTMLEVVSCTSGTILSDRNVTVNEAYSDTKIRMSFDGDEPLSKGGIILNATFNVLPGASGTVKFEVEKFKLYDENYEAIEISETVSDLMHIVNDANTEVSVSCAENVNTGENLTVTVDISNALNVCGGSFNLVYDADKFTLTSATAGSVLSGFSRQLNKTYATNKVRLTWAGSSVMTENGILLTVVFTAKDGVLGNADFTLEKLSVSDVNGTAIESIAKSGSTNVVCTHNVMEWSVTDVPTCTDTGTESYVCGCGHSTDTREVPATGHIEMEWIITTEATCDNTGVKEYTCKACGYVEKNEEIPAHGHVYESVITPPTQAEQGYTTHTCTGCGHSYKDTYTDATGYTVSYDLNGGENTIASQTKMPGESIVLSDIIPTRTGYTFLGWATDKNAENAQYYAGNTYSTDADLALYAIWDAHEHTITYVVDGETVSVQTYDYEALINALAEPSKEGYTFSGWDEIPVTMPDEDITVSGNFSINPYIVNFDANGGENAPDELTDVYNSTVTIPESIPTKEGFTFVGWATSNRAKKAEYNVGDSITLTKDVNLYAVWVGIWSGNASEKFSGGNGTKTNPYIIKTSEELKLIADKVNSGDTAYASACYIMVNDIALNDVSNVDNWATEAPANEWIPIGNSTYPFTGTFDGNGYVISGLYINQYQENETGYHKGLFGFVSGGTITNLGIEKGYFKAYRYSGALVGGTYGATIKNCYNKIPVTGDVNVAGIVGAVNTQETKFTIENCYNEGTIAVGSYSGGVLGSCIATNPIQIKSCYNVGKVTGGEQYVGGLVGYLENNSDLSVADCYNLGAVSAKLKLAGVVGCINSSTDKQGIITNCYNGGNVSSSSPEYTSINVGGVVGHCINSQITKCYNYGSVSSPGKDDGAVCAFAETNSFISDCYNVSDIKSSGNFGGIVGVAAGDVVIKNCFNSGNIETNYRAAGISPWMENANAINCINIGTIKSGENAPVGAITTNSAGTVTDCYYLDTCGAGGEGMALTYSELQSCANYSYYATQSTGTWKNHWTMGHNPYGVYPIPKGMTNLMEIPIELDINGGYFDEHVFCASIVPSQKNVARGTDFLVVYNNSNTSTGTDNHGYEVIVDSRNNVIDLKDLDGDNTVPKGGFILSGHGMMHEWLQKNIELGDKVYYDANNYEVKVYKKNPKFNFSYGHITYLPTPHKNGYVFGGWYNENDSLVTYGTKIYGVDTLKLHAKWAIPEPVAETSYGTRAYKLFDTATSYASAKKYCESIGGHLATITDEFENDEIHFMLSKGTRSGYLIGANDMLSEGAYVWDTGERFSYTNWSSNEPNDSSPGEEILEIYTSDGLWNDIKDAYISNRGFVCEFDNYKPSREFIHNGHLYQIYHSYDDGESWEYAKKFCEDIGGHLVTITSEEENIAIVNEVKSYTSTLSAPLYTTPFFWLGASDVDEEGDWKWVTGEDWNYTNWNTNQPDDAGGKEHYLHMYTESSRFGKWNDLPNKYSTPVSFICEFDSVSPVAEAEFNGHKYLLFDTATNWINAQAYCESLGGYLATLTTPEEEAFVALLCANNSTRSGYYLGATDTENEGSWQWITGEKWDYTNWNDGEPNNASSVEHYLEIWNCGTAPAWNDIPDKYYNNYGFICEISVFDTTLTYDANGGENAPEVFECKTDTDITLSSKVPTRPGYIFKGWSETKDGEVKYQPSQTIRISKSTTLYAAWEERIYLIYDANGGENEPERVECKRNVDATVSYLRPIKPGYMFKGWSETKDGEVKYQPSQTIRISKSTTLHAVWEEKNYTITYDANGGENAPDTQIKAHGIEICLSQNVPIRDGYTFVGWSTLNDVSKTVEECVINNIHYDEYIQYLPGESIIYNESLQLYAVWVSKEIAQNKITYYYYDQIVYIQAYNEYTQLFHGYYEMSGWTTDKNSEEVEYWPWSDFWGQEDICMYATGSMIGGISDVEIFFDANGGENAPNTQLHGQDEWFILSTQIPTKEDCVFVGWATTPDAKEAEYFPGERYGYDNTLYLYAIWKPEIEGVCGDEITWNIISGVLSIIGIGAIFDYEAGTTPWYEYRAGITDILISDGITSIGDYAFYNLTALKSVKTPDSLTNIGEYAFSNCTSLSSIDTSKVTSIGNYAFRYCFLLSDIDISSTTTYGVNVYANCSNIKTVNINDGVSEIKAGLLDNCGTIDVLNIPGSVTKINENAFADCSFTSVVYSGTKDEFAKLLTSKNLLNFDTVTCEADNKIYLYSDFFAENVNITGISLEKKSIGLSVGECTQIVATVTPSNTTEKLEWSSDNETVATVDGTGNITAISEGVANITVTSESGAVQASCVVYINNVIDENAPAITVESIEETKNGDTFDVNISLKNNPGIISMRLALAYDTSVMELTNVTDSGLLGDALHSEDYSGDEYVLYWDNGTSKTNFTENGKIATLTFNVKDNAKSGNYPLTISYGSQDIINSDILPVGFDVVNGFVTVKAFTYGDVNSDESVDTMDSAYLSRHIARWSGITINSDAADVNKDKKINVLDSAILKRHIANWPDYGNLPYYSPAKLFSTTNKVEELSSIISVSDAKGQSGKTVDVTISIKDNPGIVNMRLDVDYDKEALVLTKVTDLGLLPGEVHSNVLTDMPYCLYWDNGASKTDYTANGDLVKLTFEVKENAAYGNYPIAVSYNYDEPDIINAILKPVKVDINNGAIEIVDVIKPQIALSNVEIGEKTNFTLQLLSPSTISGMVFVATYDKDTSKLCKLEKYDAMVQKDFSINTENGEVVKIMWWDSFENLKPIADSVIVSEE